ncbi:SDR family oxidoreductase [Collimonas sp. H4R21]|jgi:NAD(P)-dependent dehydrogenase (short-subunit alcohol dehydrogenase family)|uniref:SDR family oxidoreductase n=1 Tax=Collimonas rhizosphaerae TaxID=3126357 RepID=A0ABU9PS43_9BURK|nr:SDR family oxidoreductase [Collimonas sp. OK412]SFB95695.1 NAD(P)-dependent dehydrogenase, short-chain alcohol dehydrogenase family [Collimonas sp. OK412]
MGKLDGKTVLITGGSSGIGLASAKLFLEQGARLAITGRDPDGLARVREELGGDVLTIRSDTANLTEIASLMQQVERRFTRLDVLFVNAAIATAAPMELVSETQFDDIMGINFKGAFFTIQKALPLFSGAASIIVTTSIANQLGSPNFSVYGASKAALRSLVQSLALELISRGIRINAISPGPIATPIFDRFGLPPAVADGIKTEIAQKSPSKRFGLPSEVAKVALFLASDDAAYVVGEEIVVDGGMSLL